MMAFITENIKNEATDTKTGTKPTPIFTQKLLKLEVETL